MKCIHLFGSVVRMMCGYFCLCFSHEDGTVRFWDASGVSLKPLYKLSTANIFQTDCDHNDSLTQAGEEEWPPFRKVRDYFEVLMKFFFLFTLKTKLSHHLNTGMCYVILFYSGFFHKGIFSSASFLTSRFSFCFPNPPFPLLQLLPKMPTAVWRVAHLSIWDSHWSWFCLHLN